MRKECMKKFCKDFEKIENYDKVMANLCDKWCCHHRLETRNSDGELRKVFLSREELIALDMYYNRPPEELIFMTVKEHNILHNSKGGGAVRSSLSEKRKAYWAEAKKNNTEAYRKMKERFAKANENRIFTEEHLKKIGEASKRNWQNEEYRKKVSKALKGHAGFGGKRHSEESKAKISASLKARRTAARQGE